MKDLFNFEDENIYIPLAEKMRPSSLDDFVGQEDIIGIDSALRKMIENDSITSMIFWGPPGVGKTTLAKIIAQKTNSVFKQLSAVTSGVKDIKELIVEQILIKQMALKQFFLLMKFIVLIKLNKMPFYLMLKMAI